MLAMFVRNSALLDPVQVQKSLPRLNSSLLGMVVQGPIYILRFSLDLLASCIFISGSESSGVVAVINKSVRYLMVCFMMIPQKVACVLLA